MTELDDLIAATSDHGLHDALRDNLGVLVLFHGKPEAAEALKTMRAVLDELERRLGLEQAT